MPGINFTGGMILPLEIQLSLQGTIAGWIVIGENLAEKEIPEPDV